MVPITEPAAVGRCLTRVAEMMLEAEENCELNPQWIRSQGWKVVPVESMGRLPVPDIPRLVEVLNPARAQRCVAVATEPLGNVPRCYVLSIDESEFVELNRTLGDFRFVVTDEGGSWAISCTEWYNLFAAAPVLLEAMLGTPIEQARQPFASFVAAITPDGPDEALSRVAVRYASL